MIDLRSDTVTRPTAEMLAAMMEARVGDDVFGEDVTVNELQRKAAKLFGMEAAIFCPSGTMTNQIAIRLHTQPGDEVICHELSHVYHYEGGGIAVNSGASVRLLSGGNGRFTAQNVSDNVNDRDDPHRAWSRLVVIENTVNKGGGACWDLAQIELIREVCEEHELALHLDGARLFNALIARDESPKQYGRLFDTISICLSKGLGAPVGSLLLGGREHIAKALRLRKLMGGGMRQIGSLGAAGIYALDHHVERLKEDHARAAAVAGKLAECAYVESVLPVETNIVIFKLDRRVGAEKFLKFLALKDIQALSLDPSTVRFVFHLDVSNAQVEELQTALAAFSSRKSPS